MVYDPVHHKVILFGGRTGFPPAGDSMGDMWSYDPASNAWTKLNPTSLPTAREAMGMVWVSSWNRVLLFGGHNGGVPGVFFDETWAYNPETNQWSNLNPSGSKPAGRFGGSMIDAPDIGKVVLFGGLIPNPLFPDLNDTWAYDHISNGWANVNPTNPPPPRQAAAIAYDGASDRIVIFGGHRGLDPGTWLNDTWALSLVGPPVIGYSPGALTLSATTGWVNPDSKTLSLWNAGNKTLNWTVETSAGWLTLSPTTGTNTGNVQVGANINGMAAGTYTATLTIQAPGASNNPQSLLVTLTLAPNALVIGWSPASFSFTATHIGANPVNQNLSLWNLEIRIAWKTLVDLCPRHIAREDKQFFYPCMRYFSETERRAMLERFTNFDRQLIHPRYLETVKGLGG
jgi:hypothetical protein